MGKNSVTDFPITEIHIGARCRKDVGDLSDLMESIESIGLLHPVVVRPDGHLVAGFRRIKAFEQLGRDSVPAHVVGNLKDAASMLIAERDENTCRKDFLHSEKFALGETLIGLAEDEATERHREASSLGGAKSRKGADKGGETCPSVKQRDETKRAKSVVAAATGTGRKTYEKIEAVCKAAESEPEKYAPLVQEMDRTGKVDGAFKKLKVMKQAEAIAKEPPPLPKGPFRVIAVDPPWSYDNRADDTTHRAANPYPSMSIDDIKELDIAGMANNDCVLWLWTTNSHLREAFEIAEHWGFTYKTMLTWVKDRMGTGDWLRGKTEHCLMCVLGKPTIVLTNQTTVIEGPLRKHSQKPDEFYALVDGLCPGSKCEVFSREPREGWICHGDEI